MGSSSDLFLGYVGEVDKDNLPHNYGTITFANGNKYEGNVSIHHFTNLKGHWAHGKRTGYGRYFYSNGSRYEGEVYDGHLHGKGTLTFANGNHYEGTLKKTVRIFVLINQTR
jgi:hypothetical protein